MVTKPERYNAALVLGSVLAKIHMVTKLSVRVIVGLVGSVLAKIHMVTKLRSGRQ